ncbi:MAG: ATP-binding protein [Deltaproteobacteria bacterium]|nr:ATP-binding protein [Deltaproteobacteria bacterium]
MSGKLYLGRKVSTDDQSVTDDRFEYKTDRFVRHGVCIGMTGSGKTGLSVGLIEELVLEGVPVICIDPKGDLANLALVFPELRGSDFSPWVDDAEARRKGLSTEELGTKTADMWKGGLAGYDLGPDTMASLRDKMRLSLFTPGSEAGLPVNVLGALGRPAQETLEDGDSRRELITGTVSGLLSLIGVNADPVRSPEHLVVSQIIETAWMQGEDLDPEKLILQIVDPPFKKVGVFPLDRFWSPDDRMDLAMKLNGVIAAPSFQAWTKGARIDPVALTDTTDGRVPVSVFYMAHLTDSERMFFTSLLLERIVAWSRSQSGTSSLRALIFLDEAYGFMPPHPANPPTKKPLLTLMKQARAVGVGVLLSTQNPVDLDYKGLTNAGTWFLGRLSTQQDIKRVSEGMRTAGAASDDVVGLIGKMKPRQFLLRDVKDDKPTLFNTRWVMSYLRGPITRHEIERLPNLETPPASTAALAVASTSTPAAIATSAPAATPAPTMDDGLSGMAPPAPRGTNSYFLDPRSAFSARMEGAFDRYARAARGDGAVEYAPAVYANVRLRFDEERHGYSLDEDHHMVWLPLDGRSLPDEPISVPLDDRDLLQDAPSGRFHPLPTWLDESKEFTAAKRDVVDRIYREETRGQWVCAPLKLHGKTNETREAFEARCREAVEDKVDAALGKLHGSYETKVKRIEEKVRKKENQIDQLEGKAKAEKAAEVVNIGEVVLSFFVGRKRSMGSVLTKRKTAANTARRIDAAEDDLETYQEQLEELAEELEEATEELEEKHGEALEEIEERQVTLEKNDIDLRDFGILWVPVTRRI